MASEGAVAKRANLVASRVHWSHMESITAQDQEAHATGSSSKDSVRKWLTTAVIEEDAKHEPLREATEPLKWNPSSDDDLALGVEASLYGNQGVRTVQEFLRWSRSSPALSRLNSFSSATSGHSGPLSVMDILNLWNDDPEEVLLDLGFGCDEPDLSGRIPARFINHQSQARGINLQVFLEAQKNRLDLENPDVSNRFRQLEVLQQVTTAFSSLVGSSSSSSSPLRAPQGKDLPPEAREKRRRMGMLFRRASKKSLSQIHNHKTQDLTTLAETSLPCATPESLQLPPSIGDKKVPLKKVKPGLETVCLSPLAEEQGADPYPQAQPHVASLIAHEGALKPWPLREGLPLAVSTFLQRKKSPGQARESFEMEEIHSFDECSVTGSYTGGAEHLVQGVIRTNSCQSDSSGFLEEPFIPSLSQQASPGPDLIKALSGLSGRSNDSQIIERPGSPSPSSSHTSPSLLLSSSLTSSDVDKSVLSAPCPTPEHSLVFGPSPSPVLLCLPKSNLQNSGTETPADQDRSLPASLPALVCEYLPPCSSSPELQKVTHYQSPTLPSPAFFIPLSPTSPHMQPASLIRGSEEIKTEDKDAPYPHLSFLSHDSEETTCSTFSSVPPPASSPSSSPNLDCPFSASIALSSTESDFSSGSPGNNEYSHSASGGLSSLPPYSPYLCPTAPLDFHRPSSLASKDYPLTESLSQSPENNKRDSLFPDSGEIGLSDPPTDTQKKEEETPSSLSFQSDKDNPLAPLSFMPDSSKFEKGCPTLPCLSLKTSIPVCQSVLSSQPHDPDGFIDPAVGRISDLTEQSICQQDRPSSHDDNTAPAPASPIQDVIHVKINHLSLDLEDTRQRTGKGELEGERHTDTVQTREDVVYISDTESSAGLSEGSRLVSKEVCNQTEIDLHVPSCSLHNELSPETKQEELRKVCQMEINGTESESPRSSLVLHDEVPKYLIEIESLDMVFQTSVDCSEDENGDVDAFFQQLDTEGQVYWAEPIQVSNPTPVLEESGSFEASDGSPGNSLLPRRQADSFSSTGRAMPLSLPSSTTMDTDQTSRNATASSDTPSSSTLAPFSSSSSTPDLKPSSRSVSVQMSSSLSSHIVHRKDVPYMTDSKRTLLPSVLPLDTSTPFRAVQSWTDLQIQRNTLTNKLSHGAVHTVPNEVTVSTSASETTQRPTLIFSSSPSFPRLSNDWQSHDCLPGMAKNDCTVSVSVDKGLVPDEEEEVDRNGNEDEEKLWEGDHTATMACCCSCDHHCTCCTQKSYNKQHTLGNIHYSLDELEEMMLCLQKFRSVLSNMEEQLSEDQAAVYSYLSDQDREKVRDIEELRRTVKQEAGELEMQLNELAHHYDDSLKMLRVFIPGTVPTSLSPAPSRTVATQCCLLPWIPPADVQSGQVSSWSTVNVDSPRQSPPVSEGICEGLGCTPTKADKLDIVGFLQRLKESASFCEHRLTGIKRCHGRCMRLHLTDENLKFPKVFHSHSLKDMP
ncbi:serine-rich adhesin for platelets isoform X3 [Siniperca chuatsi]|uniref:serine-rich adhesin for platelets isoform X3 n=1 Tax=Siniperca chuatsi TaxID=119488 RepID=UPI001CE222FD|nr:serine-rich adhesin for platelets isoform X3 [Siniperca chuatsi]